MSWKTDNSIKRIFNSFKRLKTQIFNQDVEALKQLKEAIEESEKKYVNDNILFAKLLCVALRYRTEYYSDIKMALKSIDTDLKTELSVQIELLRVSLNSVDKMSYLKSIEFDLNDANLSKISELKGNEKEFLEKILNNWSHENVSRSFYNSANDFLKDMDNYI